MTAAGLTPRAHQALTFIGGYIEAHGYSPSFEDIREALSLKSKPGVSRLIATLEKRGRIVRSGRDGRSVALAPAQSGPILSGLPAHVDAKLNAYCVTYGEERMAIIADAVELFIDQREADLSTEQQGTRQ